MNTLLKVARNTIIGVALLPFEAVAVTAIAANFAVQQSITAVRKARETCEEEEGDCFFVYYPLGHMLGATVDFILPEVVGVDVVAGALNLKTQHCVAWFTTSSSSYTTIEITSGKSAGVLATKECSKMSNKELQLVVLNWNGSLRSDENQIDWRKKYTKRKKSVESIIQEAESLF